MKQTTKYSAMHTVSIIPGGIPESQSGKTATK
jgi:hypothetical protein